MATLLIGDEWGFAFQWVLATVVGWAFGFTICEAIQGFIAHLSFGVDGLIIGVWVGIGQFIVLSQHIKGAGWWILMSIVGFGFGKAAGDAVAGAIPGASGYFLGGAAIGAIVGFAQFLVLLRRVAQAGWWVLASALAWAVGWGIVNLVKEPVDAITALSYVVGVVGVALAAVVSGAAFIKLLTFRPVEV